MSFITKLLTKLINAFPFLRVIANRLVSNRLCSATKARPHAYSLWSPQRLYPDASPSNYLSWHTVTDKNYFDLHLKPADQNYVNQLPSNKPTATHPLGKVTALFKRKGSGIKGGRSTVFFMFFAQWFTDGFFRSTHHDPRKTSSNHNIDLAQIYGATEEVAYLLRSGEGGRLSSQLIRGEEYPDFLGEADPNGKWRIKEKYLSLPYVKDTVLQEEIFGQIQEEKRHYLFATGLERGSSVVGHVCFSTLFLREHNNICRELEKIYPDWNDERLFHTARIINTVVLMKLVIEDYVNHIAGLDILRLDTSFAESKNWYRTPWIAGEFNLLYRWHGLIPDTFSVKDRDEAFINNYDLLVNEGLETLFAAAAKQQAGKIELHNTPDFMLPAEAVMVNKGRDWCLRSYNDYREAFKLRRLTSFEEFTEDAMLQNELRQLYGTPDKVEFTVGLFAESSNGRTLTGDLQTAMVAYDALTQIYTNPLLSKNIFNEENFTQFGMNRINETNTFQDLVNRNISQKLKVTLNFEK